MRIALTLEARMAKMVLVPECDAEERMLALLDEWEPRLCGTASPSPGRINHGWVSLGPRTTGSGPSDQKEPPELDAPTAPAR